MMDIQAAGINSFHIYQSAREQGPGTISVSSADYRIQETQTDRTRPLPEDETQTGSGSGIQEDEAAKEEEQSSQPDAESKLSQDEKLLLEKLKKADAEVRTHEMAHIAAGGEFITSGATFSYQKGPDGQNYAVGGEVSIDTSAEPGDPEATLQKMRRVRAAALAPAHPSSQDLKVASNAASQAAKAMADITQLVADEQAGQMDTAVFGYTSRQISDTYAKTRNMTGQDPQNSFHIAV
nr:putative metalloprotease CJM1_0395 family protein [uncultured Desulfobacter sp.]